MKKEERLPGRLSERRYALSISGACAFLLIVVTLALKKSTGLQWILSGLTVGSIYALIAMGFSVIFSSTRVINFAQGEFSMLGGMLMYTFNNRAGIPAPFSFILSVLVVTLIGAGFERLVIHPLGRPGVITVVLITIGLSIFFRATAKWIWGTDTLPITPFSGEKPFSILGASLVPQSLWIFGFTLLAVILMFLFFNRTLVGKGMRAAAENPEAASLVGVSPSVTSLVAWTIAAALGASAGIIIAPIKFVSFDVGVMLGLKGFASAILGGLGYAPGAVLGGLTLGVLETIVAGVFPSGYKDAVAFLVLIVVLLLRPQGILGRQERLE